MSCPGLMTIQIELHHILSFCQEKIKYGINAYLAQEFAGHGPISPQMKLLPIYRIKERKLYELVAHAVIPCTKVSGKWLFPRQASGPLARGGAVEARGVSGP